MLDGWIELVLPTACAGCGLPGGDLCAECDADLPRWGAPACGRCGHPWSIPVTTCPECPAALDRVRHAFIYGGSARSLLIAFKDGGRRRIAERLARAMAETGPPPPGVLVPVPSTRAHLRERGFNPAAELARRLGRIWHVPTERALRRVGPDFEQRGASATERVRQVRGAFVADPRPHWPNVTLVDDVCTTGATLSACARTLRRAGARRVDAIVAARAVAVPHRTVYPTDARATIGDDSAA